MMTGSTWVCKARRRSEVGQARFLGLSWKRYDRDPYCTAPTTPQHRIPLTEQQALRSLFPYDVTRISFLSSCV